MKMGSWRTLLIIGGGCVAGLGLGADGPPRVVPLAEAKPVRLVVSAACFGDDRESAVRLGSKLLERHLAAETRRPVDLHLGMTGEEVRAALRGGAEVVMLTGDDWALARTVPGGMEPVMQSQGPTGIGASWVLLARAPLDGVAVSRGHVLVAGSGDGALPMVWLQEWRQTQGLVIDPPPPTHRITREPKATLGLLRTFFGKADACVVPEAVFVEACGQNPELARRLRRLACSPPLPGAIVAVTSNPSQPEAPLVRRAAQRLASTPHGAALASLLGVRKFAPFSATSWPDVASMIKASPHSRTAKAAAVAANPLPNSGPPPPP